MLKKVEKCFSLLNFSWLLWIHLKSTCEMFTWKMNDTCNFLHMAIFLITYLCLFLYYPILCHWSLSVSSENMISGIKKKNGGMKWVKTWRLHVIHINIYSFTPKIEELYGVPCLFKVIITQREYAALSSLRESIQVHLSKLKTFWIDLLLNFTTVMT